MKLIATPVKESKRCLDFDLSQLDQAKDEIEEKSDEMECGEILSGIRHRSLDEQTRTDTLQGSIDSRSIAVDSAGNSCRWLCLSCIS